jgi:probable addiction module antidote protein
MRKAPLAPLDVSEHLDSDDVIAQYLPAAFEDPNPELFLLAIGNVARVRGMAKVAKDAGLGRESLYKALAPRAKPRYETVRKRMDSLGVRMTVTPVLKNRHERREQEQQQDQWPGERIPKFYGRCGFSLPALWQ